LNPVDPKLLIIGIIITILLFAIIAFSFRAGYRRIIGVVIASIPVIPMIMVFDKIAAQYGWWNYPSVTNGNAPLAWYLAAAIGYGAAFGLVGWRMIRRWQYRGLIIFLVIISLFGVTRDYLYSITTNFIIFGNGPMPFLADIFAYGSAAAVVQLIMRLIVGSAKSDNLSRVKKE
jgi:hypothetical protein